MWRKSSKSADASQCVEVRHDLAAVRDSKNPEVVVSLERRALAQLTAFARGRR
ncbi:DUF397 domain-containing protein [Actinophytocola xanthii]|uniref:DUF397 domain-containing protein n=1 Tax=Actinophytocola xanthii TaxID=1912961 RepID=UPI0009FB33A9|nr:DUF397 domain-containing protein [Actinophytocola xanthii]